MRVIDQEIDAVELLEFGRAKDCLWIRVETDDEEDIEIRFTLTPDFKRLFGITDAEEAKQEYSVSG